MSGHWWQVWGKTGAKLYGQKSGRDFSDNQRRFLLFSKAALAALHSLPFSPGTEAVVVCNDWHTAILPVLLKARCCRSPGAHITCMYDLHALHVHAGQACVHSCACTCDGCMPQLRTGM
jgi:glycogen synthase